MTLLFISLICEGCKREYSPSVGLCLWRSNYSACLRLNFKHWMSCLEPQRWRWPKCRRNRLYIHIHTWRQTRGSKTVHGKILTWPSTRTWGMKQIKEIPHRGADGHVFVSPGKDGRLLLLRKLPGPWLAPACEGQLFAATCWTPDCSSFLLIIQLVERKGCADQSSPVKSNSRGKKQEAGLCFFINCLNYREAEHLDDLLIWS